MVRMIKNLILLVVVLASVNSTLAYTLTYDELNSYINSQVLKETKEKISSNLETEIKISGIPFSNIQTNDNQFPKIEIVSQNNSFQQFSYKRVIVKDSRNNIVKSFPINVHTLVYDNVLVANELIQYGKEINSNNTNIEKREVSKYLGKTYSQNISGLTASKNYPKGAIILNSGVKGKSAILKDSIVDINFVSQKGLNIKLQGKALSEGAIGDRILVRSTKYNKTYNAIVNSSNEVTVRI